MPQLTTASPVQPRTGFNRDVPSEGGISLAEALREHSGRRARAEAIRYQIRMGLVGFVGGLVITVPFVLWLAQSTTSPTPEAEIGRELSIGGGLPTTEANASSALQVPGIVQQVSAFDGFAAGKREPDAAANETANEAVETARSLIRAGDIHAAREILVRDELRQSGQALFMLAETYDPNVLAALGATGAHAETPMARRYYEAALIEGVSMAAPRINALE